MNQRRTCITTVFLPITKMGANNFPQINKLDGLKIQAISLMTGVKPLDGTTGIDSAKDAALYLDLTENGVDFFMQNTQLSLFDFQENKNIDIPINRTLSVMNCFVDVQDSSYIGKTLVFCFWYEHPLYSTGYSDECLYENFDAPVGTNGESFPSYMPDFKNLKGKAFSNIYVTFPNITPNYRSGITEEEAASVYVTFIKGSYSVLENVPLLLFKATGKYCRINFDGIVWDFDSSYTKIAKGVTPFNGYVNFVVKYR